MDPAAFAALNSRGYAYLQKAISTAIRDFTEAIKRGGASSQTLAHRGLARFRLGDPDGAIADLDDAVRTDKKNLFAFRYAPLCTTTAASGRRQLTTLRAIIRVDPNWVQAYQTRGVNYAQVGKIDLAVEDFTVAIRLNPRDPMAYLGRASCLAGQKRYGAASLT